MAGRKRKLQEMDVSEIVETSDSATVSGIVTELSPVKVSRNQRQVKQESFRWQKDCPRDIF